MSSPKPKKLYQYKSLWLFSAVALYSVLAYFLLPTIIRQQLQTQLTDQLGMRAEMTAVKFNPLTFNTNIKNLKITDSNHQTWYDSQLTGVNFDPLNLLWGEWKISDVKVIQAQVTLVLDAEGQLLIPALPELPAPTSHNEPINLTIGQINLEQAHIKLQANNFDQDFTLNFKNIVLQHEAFNLTDEIIQFSLSLTTENNETVALNGHYQQTQKQLNTEIQLQDIQATRLNQLLPASTGIITQAGIFQAKGSLIWPLIEKPLLNFSHIDVQAYQGQWHEAVQVNALDLLATQVMLDSESQTLHIEHINSTQGNWQINWPLADLIEPELGGAPVASNDTTAETSPTWLININQVGLSHWPITWRDTDLNSTLDLSLSSFEARQLNNQNQSFSINSQVVFADEGVLQINSDQVLSPLSVHATLSLQHFALQNIAPWLSAQTGLTATQGHLYTQQQLNLSADDFTMAGQLNLQNSHLINANAQTFASWDKLHIGNSKISSHDRTVVLDQITLAHATGHFPTNAEQNLNSKHREKISKPMQDQVNKAGDDWQIKIGSITTTNTQAVN